MPAKARDGDAAVRAVLWGTGRLGSELARIAAARRFPRLVGAIVTDPAKDGRDLGEIAGVGRSLGAVASCDADAVLARDDVDLVIDAGVSGSQRLAERLERVAAHGKDAVALSGLIHPPTALGEARARELTETIRAAGCRVTTTGVGGGFIQDVLPVVLLSTTPGWTRVTTLMSSATKAGGSVLRGWGIGLRPDELPPFERSAQMEESAALLADTLALPIDEVLQTQEPIVSAFRRELHGVVVEPGTVAGFRWRAAVRAEGRERIVLERRTAVAPVPEDDVPAEWSVEIEGDGRSTARLRLTGDMTRDGYPATASRGLSVIPGLRALPPGFHYATQIPFAGAALGGR